MTLKKRSTNSKIVPINWMHIAKNWSKNSIILRKRNNDREEEEEEATRLNQFDSILFMLVI